MLARLRAHRPSHTTVVAYLALFLALGGGAAYAADTVFSSDIVDNEVRSADVRNDNLTGGGLTPPDLRAGSVRGSEVLNDSLTGLDVSEGTLGQVPRALLGGFGRSTSVGGQCNPEGEQFATCAYVTLNIPPPGARVLMVGAIRASTEIDSDTGIGDCRVATSTNQIPSGTSRVAVQGAAIDHVPLTGIATVGPGQVDFGVECNEINNAWGIRYSDMTISAVAISPN